MDDAFEKWFSKSTGRSENFSTQPHLPGSENLFGQKCTRVIIQPPGRAGLQDASKLWMLGVAESSLNVIHKSTSDDIHGVDQFQWYPEPRYLSGLGGSRVRSLGYRWIDLRFRFDDDPYPVQVEIIDDSEDDDFDVLLGGDFFRHYQINSRGEPYQSMTGTTAVAKPPSELLIDSPQPGRSTDSTDYSPHNHAEKAEQDKVGKNDEDDKDVDRRGKNEEERYTVTRKREHAEYEPARQKSDHTN